MSDIGMAAVGVALCDADHKIREEGGNNKGPRIRQYLENTDPPIHTAAPWCAAAVQYWADVAARGLGLPNPLDAVKLEAYVQAYHDTLKADVVPAGQERRGYLVLFNFGGSRWDHIGLVAIPTTAASPKIFWSVEGNTGDTSQRDGDGVYLKPRTLGQYPVEFIKW